MKRSKMVEHLEHALRSYFPNQQELFDYTCASAILGRLEHEGMLPPEYWRPKNYEDGYKLTYSEWCQLSSTIREWEAEETE